MTCKWFMQVKSKKATIENPYHNIRVNYFMSYFLINLSQKGDTFASLSNIIVAPTGPFDCDVFLHKIVINNVCLKSHGCDFRDRTSKCQKRRKKRSDQMDLLLHSQTSLSQLVLQCSTASMPRHPTSSATSLSSLARATQLF
jgi:hypothetical protein